jgi:2-polyprenyl-3-methyl-5-hydroxy-6-metoxy-1,4-benzoquinol methylase
MPGRTYNPSMPTAERYQQYASHYARSGNHAPDWHAAGESPERFARRSEWLPQDKNARILDIGCGWGNLLMSLWCAGYRRLEGIDLSPEQAAIGNHSAEGRVLIHCGDGGEFLSGRRSEYDLITLVSVIEHIPTNDVVPFLTQVRLALAPGGRIVLYAPNMANLTSAWIQFSDVTHATGFTELSIQQVLDQAGFEDHRFVTSRASDLSQWRISKTWRGLGLGQWANNALHRLAYSITGQSPRPSCFAANLEVYSHRPAAERSARGLRS